MVTHSKVKILCTSLLDLLIMYVFEEMSCYKVLRGAVKPWWKIVAFNQVWYASFECVMEC